MFENCIRICRFVPAQRTKQLVDEKSINMTLTLNKTHEQVVVGSIDAGKALGQQVRVIGNSAPLEASIKVKVPLDYATWLYLFEEAADADALLEHKPWDYEITLQEGKQLTFEPIYGLSEKHLKATREYIQERLAKGYIRESKSPAGYLILFVPKKSGNDRLCVDY